MKTLLLRTSFASVCTPNTIEGEQASNRGPWPRRSRSGRTALTWIVSRGGCGGATTGLAVKSKGIPNTSAYSCDSPISVCRSNRWEQKVIEGCAQDLPSSLSSILAIAASASKARSAAAIPCSLAPETLWTKQRPDQVERACNRHGLHCPRKPNSKED